MASCDASETCLTKKSTRRRRPIPFSIPVLANIEALTTGWLSAALETEVLDFSASQIVGEGYASRMYRLNLRYEAIEHHPSTLILKLVTDNLQMSELLEDDALFREVFFYQNLADHVADVLPKIYYSGSDASSRQLTLLMEDLGDIPHKKFSESLPNSISAMQILARCHAAFWNAEILSSPSLTPLDSVVDADAVETLFKANIEIEMVADYRYPYLRKSVKNVAKVVKWILGEADLFSGPITLMHGDFHARNIYFTSDRVMVFDWQQAERGSPARDVIYWLVTSVEPRNFLEFQPLLIDAYLKALDDNGVDYSRKSFMKDFSDTAAQLIPRIYCFQSLIEWSDEDRHELLDFLTNADSLARQIHLLALARLARIFAPVAVTVLRWFGKR
ncbi:MAG: thiamine kinase-like enzyme [Litorivivens sp.]|jgi:thiamine kinase-like enzyme